jgi:O-antigen ligase
MRRASRRTCAIAFAAVGIAIVGAVAASGGPRDAFESIRAGFTSPVGQTGVRIGIGSNFRDHWWGTAWNGFVDAPLRGSGAGTFRLLEQTTRSPSFTTGSTHNTVLEVLAGTGLAGALPFAASGVAILVLGIRGIRRAGPDDAVGATAVALMAFGLMGQGLVDVDWSLIALGVPLLAAVGAIAAPPGLPTTSRSGLRVPLGVLALLLAAAGLFALPFWYSARVASQSVAQLDTNPLGSLERASVAHRLNPLAVEPLMAQADAYANLGDAYAARRSLIEAIRLEPRNYEPWLAYGTYLAYTWNDLPAGRSAIERAVRLAGGDPGAQSVLDTLPPS